MFVYVLFRLTNVQVCTSSVMFAKVVPLINQSLSQHTPTQQLHRNPSHIWEDNMFLFILWLAFPFDLAFLFGSFCFYNGSLARLTAGFQSLSTSDVSVVVFGLCICRYSLCPVVWGPDYFQFVLHWMVWIRKQGVICVSGFSINLNIKFTSFFFSLHRNVCCWNWCCCLPLLIHVHPVYSGGHQGSCGAVMFLLVLEMSLDLPSSTEPTKRTPGLD